jgi:hypothetical protein
MDQLKKGINHKKKGPSQGSMLTRNFSHRRKTNLEMQVTNCKKIPLWENLAEVFWISKEKLENFRGSNQQSTVIHKIH